MKFKHIFCFCFLLTAMSFAPTAFAQWFPARAQVIVLPTHIQAEVYNPYYEPIICQGRVFGQTAWGPVYQAFFLEQFLPIGAYRFSYVKTLPNNPFISGWANVFCRFARLY